VSEEDAPGPDEIRAPALPARGVHRRDFLRSLATVGAGAALAPALGGSRCATPAEVFPDGIKSGDPRPRQSVIWTRVAPPPGGGPVPVLWEVARDAEFREVVAGGVAKATAANGHTVKVWVTPIRSDAWFFYRFTAWGVQSVTGRLRTAPLPGASVDRLRYAFASCQQRGQRSIDGRESLYVAHRAIANEGVDFLMHLGDYIYVNDGFDTTVDRYRRRYGIFHSNPMLQELQARVPLVPVWDDGEFYNGVDSTGDPARLAAARQVWFEMMPVLRPPDEDRIYRTLPWGALADVILLDTRQYRDPEVPFLDSRVPPGSEMMAEGRTTLGAVQKAWLKQELSRSLAHWRFLGSSYNVGAWKSVDHDTPELRMQDPPPPRNAGIYVPNEAWDDYQAERRELLEYMLAQDVENVVFTSGHTHIYLAHELQPDFDDLASPVAAFDFVTGSQTADPDPARTADEPLTRFIESVFLQQNHPYMKHINMWNQGYAVVDVTPEELNVHFRVIDTFDPDAEPRTYVRFRVASGSRRMEVFPGG